FHGKIADVANKEFLEMKHLKGILIGGPGPTKETFLNENLLNNELKRKVLAVKDLSYTGDFGLKELVEKSNDVLSEQASIKEKELLDKFFTLLAKEPKKVVYGKEKTMNALEMSAVDVIILCDSVDDTFVDEIEEKATLYGTNVEIISIETELGNQLKELGEIAGFLRFEVY
ncbi:MAG: peptide chain release factor 1, partial [Nanoarchaeota archaeon]